MFLIKIKFFSED